MNNKASLNLYVRMVLPVQAGLGKNAWTGVLVAASKLQRGPEPWQLIEQQTVLEEQDYVLHFGG